MSRRALTAREASVVYGRWKDYPNVGEVFEEVIRALYSAHIRPGDLCVDGGAHHGRHTVPMGRLVGHGTVHAYEPIPELAELLAQHATEARVRERIVIHICALAEAEGVRDFVSFYDPSELYPAGYSGLRKRTTPKDWPWRTIRTPVTTLDSSLAGLNGVAFIKLDLEGGEYHALLGGEQIIKSQRPLIVFESGRRDAASLYEYETDEFFGLFERLGYELADILGTGVTRELWENADWLPWYLIAVPRELGWPNWMASSIDTVLRRHGCPPVSLEGHTRALLMIKSVLRRGRALCAPFTRR